MVILMYIVFEPVANAVYSSKMSKYHVLGGYFIVIQELKTTDLTQYIWINGRLFTRISQ